MENQQRMKAFFFFFFEKTCLFRCVREVAWPYCCLWLFGPEPICCVFLGATQGKKTKNRKPRRCTILRIRTRMPKLLRCLFLPLTWMFEHSIAQMQRCKRVFPVLLHKYVLSIDLVVIKSRAPKAKYVFLCLIQSLCQETELLQNNTSVAY